MVREYWRRCCAGRRESAGALRDAEHEGSLPSTDTDEMARKLLTYELGALAFARVRNDLEPLDGMFEVWLRMAGGSQIVKQDEQSPAVRL